MYTTKHNGEVKLMEFPFRTLFEKLERARRVKGNVSFCFLFFFFHSFSLSHGVTSNF